MVVEVSRESGDVAELRRQFAALTANVTTLTAGMSARIVATHRLTVYDPLCRRNYLVEIGAEVSVLLVSSPNKLFRQQLKLMAANFTPIAMYGLLGYVPFHGVSFWLTSVCPY